MAAPSVSVVELSPGYYQALCRCQYPTCDQTIRAELVAAGASHPDDQYLASRHLPIQEQDHKNAVIIICEYLRRLGSPFSEAITLSEVAYEHALEGLKVGDVAALHAQGRDYAPFYCWRCPAVYCYEHMGYEEVWEEDYFSSMPDYWKGTCPYGHPQFANH